MSCDAVCYCGGTGQNEVAESIRGGAGPFVARLLLPLVRQVHPVACGLTLWERRRGSIDSRWCTQFRKQPAVQFYEDGLRAYLDSEHPCHCRYRPGDGAMFDVISEQVLVTSARFHTASRRTLSPQDCSRLLNAAGVEPPSARSTLADQKSGRLKGAQANAPACVAVILRQPRRGIDATEQMHQLGHRRRARAGYSWV